VLLNEKRDLLIKSRWRVDHDRDSVLFQELVDKFYKDEGNDDEEYDDEEEGDEEERLFS
jgi:hypothetical protein